MFFSWAVFVIFFDLAYRRVPNELVIIGAASGIVAGALQVGWQGHLVTSLIGGASAVILLLPGYMFRRCGAGDVKAAAVIGLWGGVGVVLGAVAAAGVLSLLWYAVAPRRAAPDGVRVQSAVRLPYGAFLAIGAAATMAAGL